MKHFQRFLHAPLTATVGGVVTVPVSGDLVPVNPQGKKEQDEIADQREGLIIVSRSPSPSGTPVRPIQSLRFLKK
jgi:hypothetical protein